MEMSVREAKARFSAALAAAERGEPVVVTRHGKPVARIMPFVAEPTGVDWEKAARIRKELGIAPVGSDWVDDFNDPAFSRALLGLDD
ncbi:type II toxin-antitoxin system Phd/YefM family antitoxin [Polymorphobacter fuscus]|nr:type II toxin-antitoxin system prevent-host-death family antitoxin [Polymorphobacter fuscus]NJC09107.1 prevent-host-death family protein [Polymorphobacter fuscus]